MIARNKNLEEIRNIMYKNVIYNGLNIIYNCYQLDTFIINKVSG